jgi:hypothetical protein
MRPILTGHHGDGHLGNPSNIAVHWPDTSAMVSLERESQWSITPTAKSGLPIANGCPIALSPENKQTNCSKTFIFHP